MKHILAAGAFALIGTTSAQAGVVTYTDFAAFQAALGGAPLVTETFDGPRVDFLANSTGNAIGSGMTLDLIGGVGDAGPTGLNGSGQLQGEVDNAGGDILSLTFNFASALTGFGFVIQDTNSTPEFDVEEVGFRVLGQSFLLSDVLGLSDSSDGASVPNTTGGPEFFGVISDVAFSSFDIVHGGLVAPGGVTGAAERFDLETAYLAPVSLPAGLPLLLAGLGGLALVRRRAKG